MRNKQNAHYRSVFQFLKKLQLTFIQKALDDLGLTATETCDIFKASLSLFLWSLLKLSISYDKSLPLADSRHRPEVGQFELRASDEHGRDGGVQDRERVRALRRRRARQGRGWQPPQRPACQMAKTLHRSVAAGAESLVSDLSANEAAVARDALCRTMYSRWEKILEKKKY